MAKDLDSNVNENKRITYDLNIEPPSDEIVLDCSICLEPMFKKDDDRTLVKLRCDHQFHLDCIGSAFNAKNKMQCPNCRNIENGQWMSSSSLPIPDSTVHDLFPDAHLRFSSDLSFGMEPCPFDAFRLLNPSMHPNLSGTDTYSPEPRSNGTQRCPYVEYTLLYIQSSPASVTETSNFSNQRTTGSGEVPNLHGSHVDSLSRRSNSSELIPLSLIPTNPRLFQSVSDPEFIRARYYFAHPFVNHSSVDGFGSSIPNVPVFRTYPHSSLTVNAPMTWSYQGGSSVANGLVASTSRNNNIMPIELVHYQLLMRDLRTSVQSLMGGLPTPFSHGPYGREQLAREVSTSFGSNQARDNGFMRFNVLGRETLLDRTLQQHRIERNLPGLATSNFIEESLLHHMLFGGGGGRGSGNDGGSGGEGSGRSRNNGRSGDGGGRGSGNDGGSGSGESGGEGSRRGRNNGRSGGEGSRRSRNNGRSGGGVREFPGFGSS